MRNDLLYRSEQFTFYFVQYAGSYWHLSGFVRVCQAVSGLSGLSGFVRGFFDLNNQEELIYENLQVYPTRREESNGAY